MLFAKGRTQMNMREWSVLEWVAFAALFVGAIILAVDTGAKQTTGSVREFFSGFIEKPIWGFLPLGLLLLATLIMGARALGWIDHAPPTADKTSVAFSDIKLKQIVNKSYK